LEYLSDSTEYVYCLSEQKAESKVEAISKQLKSFLIDKDEGKYDFKSYKINYMTKKIKIIVLMGRTGQGKSALVNVLSGSDKTVSKITEEGKLEKTEQKELKESGSSKSETRSIQAVEFEHEGETYQIIDSIGIGDTSLTQGQVLREIAQGYEIIKEGVHQVLFVNGERFTPEEVETFNLLKEFFFNANVDKYTTIVRTKFADFEDEEECKKDVELLLAESNSAITRTINSCNGVIHVDNPSINIKGKRGERDNPRNKEIREASREKLLEELEK
jgi:energy-coupling factor transporter ATP-binding protein EcfA2